MSSALLCTMLPAIRPAIRPCLRASVRALEQEAEEPSTLDLARFALPTLGAWLVSPMMSLIDTGVVGRCASSVELAALGPATMVGDACSYLFSFLSVATTNLVASQLTRDPDAVVETVATGARLALLCGLASIIFQWSLGRPILARYTAARSAALVGPAAVYVRVRALGAPAALLSRVCIAACLATKDAITPLLVVSASGIINLALTTALVPSFGIRGAALATVFSELVGAIAIVSTITRKLRPSLRSTGTPRRLPAILAPSAALRTFLGFARPLLLVLIGKIATYSSLAHVATMTGLCATAAHRVLMSVYWSCWPFAEVVSQCAQAFLPATMLPASQPDWPSPGLHVNARSQQNPSYPPRCPVADGRVEWSVPWPEYAPAVYTDDHVIENSRDRLARGEGGRGWADPGDVDSIREELLTRRTYTHGGGVVAGLDFEPSSGAPLNPRGRTGIQGRGLLGKWGPNHAADPIVTRWRDDSSTGTRMLQVVAIRRADNGQWALPGGMVDPGEDVSLTLRREFEEEAGALSEEAERLRFGRLSDALFKEGATIYAGYVDDPRNTDNAWMESVAVHFHCPDELGQRLQLRGGDDATKAAWIDVDPIGEPRYASLYASHREWVDQVDQAMQEKLTDQPAGSAAREPTLRRKLLVGGVATGGASALGSAVLLMVRPQAFTTDVGVAAIIRSLSPLVCGCIAQLGIMCAMEGTLLAARDLRFLSTFYTANAVAMVLAFQAVERRGLGLHAAWGCMLGFQLCRVITFAARLRHVDRRNSVAVRLAAPVKPRARMVSMVEDGSEEDKPMRREEAEEEEEEEIDPLSRDLVFILNSPFGVLLFFGITYAIQSLVGGVSEQPADFGPISLDGVF